MDLDRYRAEADEFVQAISREHYLHFSGQKDDYEIEAIYERHPRLFAREAVDELRGAREVGMTPVLIVPYGEPVWPDLRDWDGLRIERIPEVLDLL